MVQEEEEEEEEEKWRPIQEEAVDKEGIKLEAIQQRPVLTRLPSEVGPKLTTTFKSSISALKVSD